jgi:prefoldin subunit 5
MSDIVERLRDYKKRFIFQGASQFALSLAADIERLRARVEELEKMIATVQNASADSKYLYRDEAINRLSFIRAALKEAKP